jgi:hypothetical protein
MEKSVNKVLADEVLVSGHGNEINWVCYFKKEWKKWIHWSNCGRQGTERKGYWKNSY